MSFMKCLLQWQLQTKSENDNDEQVGKVGVNECVPYLSDVDTSKGGNFETQNDSLVLFSDKLRSKFGMRRSFLQGGRSKEDSQVTEVQFQQNGNNGSNDEWIEQYEPGVHITLTSLPCGELGLKRVRFR